eukprot:g7406.t1
MSSLGVFLVTNVFFREKSVFVKSQLLEKSSSHFLVCVDMVAMLGIPASSHLFCLAQSCAVVVWFLP